MNLLNLIIDDLTPTVYLGAAMRTAATADSPTARSRGNLRIGFVQFPRENKQRNSVRSSDGISIALLQQFKKDYGRSCIQCVGMR